MNLSSKRLISLSGIVLSIMFGTSLFEARAISGDMEATRGCKNKVCPQICKCPPAKDSCRCFTANAKTSMIFTKTSDSVMPPAGPTNAEFGGTPLTAAQYAALASCDCIQSVTVVPAQGQFAQYLIRVKTDTNCTKDIVRCITTHFNVALNSPEFDCPPLFGQTPNFASIFKVYAWNKKTTKWVQILKTQITDLHQTGTEARSFTSVCPTICEDPCAYLDSTNTIAYFITACGVASAPVELDLNCVEVCVSNCDCPCYTDEVVVTADAMRNDVGLPERLTITTDGCVLKVSGWPLLAPPLQQDPVSFGFEVPADIDNMENVELDVHILFKDSTPGTAMFQVCGIYFMNGQNTAMVSDLKETNELCILPPVDGFRHLKFTITLNKMLLCGMNYGALSIKRTLSGDNEYQGTIYIAAASLRYTKQQCCCEPCPIQHGTTPCEDTCRLKSSTITTDTVTGDCSITWMLGVGANDCLMDGFDCQCTNAQGQALIECVSTTLDPLDPTKVLALTIKVKDGVDCVITDATEKRGTNCGAGMISGDGKTVEFLPAKMAISHIELAVCCAPGVGICQSFDA